MGWTSSQMQAIESRGKNILVSAAAGSGKTAVLVQRIIDIIIRERVDVGNILVVTFTKAAASEMKERIRSRLMEELTKEGSRENLSYIRKQLNALAKASIGTMHSFCVELIRKNFHHIGLDPSARVANESVVQILKNEAMDQIIHELYEAQDRTFQDLVDAYGGKRNDKNLRDLMAELYRFIQSQPDPSGWILEKAEEFNIDSTEDFEKTSWAAAIREDIALRLEEMRSFLEEGLTICRRDGGPKAYEAALLSDDDMVLGLINRLDRSLAEYFEQVALCTHERLKTINQKTAEKENIRPEWMEEVKDLRQSVKDIIKEQKKSVGAESLQKQIGKLKKLYPMMKKLADMLILFDQRYKLMKLEKGLLDFNDLEHYALDILKEKEVREELRARYSYIFFDEYQDSNIVQETILSAICREDNLFLVGDVKQSIYRFRLSDPTLFIRRYEAYQENSDPLGMKIDLSSNFRSRKGILDFANAVFGRLMSKELGEVDYDEAAKLISGADFPDENDHVEVVLLENTKKENQETEEELGEEWDDVDSITLEALYTAKRIRELIGKDRYDPKSKRYEKVGYNDIVILMRSLTKKADIFAKVLKEQNIPCYVEQSGSYFDVPEVQLFLNLLRLVDNPMQDEALLSVMTSSVGGFTPEELSRIRIAERLQKKEEDSGDLLSFYRAMLSYQEGSDDELADKIKKFTDKIEHYRLQSRLLRLEDFVWTVLEDSGIYRLVGAMPGGTERKKNLEALAEKTLQYKEINTGGLFGFLRFVEKILQDKISSSEGKTFIQQSQVVRLMSIHKSKGLEFPIVFICNTDNGFNKMDRQQDIQVHSTLGLGPKYVNLKQNTYTDSIAKKAIKIRSTMEMLSEEMRILYVAITRAVDRLIIVGCVKDLTRVCTNYCQRYSKMTLMKQKSFLAWMMTVLSQSRDAAAVRARAEKESDGYSPWSEEEEQARFLLTILSKSELIDYVGKEDKEKDDRRTIPTQIEEDEALTAWIKERFAFEYPYYEDTVRRPKKSVTMLLREHREHLQEDATEIPIELPRFMEGKRAFSAMEKGSILHFVMEMIDFQKADTRSDIESQIQTMVEKEILTEEEAQIIPVEKIEHFLHSPLGERMSRSASVHREVRFLMNREDSIIDGVVDCYFEEDGELVLIDYKSDTVHSDVQEIVKRYEMQLHLYRQALKESTGKTVKESYLYLFDIDHAVRVFEKDKK